MRATTTVAVALLFLAGCGKSPEPQSPAPEPPKAAQQNTVTLDAASLKEARIQIVDAAVRAIPVGISASGRLITNENTTWRVGAITDGRIIRVEVKVGDHVKKGQLLARLFSHDIHESRAQHRRAVGELSRLNSNVDFARRSRDRMRRLHQMKAASLEQLELAENTLRNEQIALENAAIEERRTRLHLTEFLQIPIDAPADHGDVPDPEVHADYLIPINAPATGIVLSREVTPGAVVNASSDLFTICDLSTIWALAAVQEEHLSRLRPGVPARVSVQAYPGRTFPGRVLKIDEKLDPETRTVSARIEIDNRAGLLKPEMYATIELDSGMSESAIFIPQDAVQDLNGQPTVFVEVDAASFRPVPVTVSRSVEGLVQVTGGLKGGERVVARGSFILKSQLLKSSLSDE
ncbi:MAG: efflux RND transporter periplasmic adaptor subunit [Bryobacteraceae bacterium]|nr:efflux RND transporter periplasmic adaptor subunit [Bryobacteraceae bacterium]